MSNQRFQQSRNLIGRRQSAKAKPGRTRTRRVLDRPARRPKGRRSQKQPRRQIGRGGINFSVDRPVVNTGPRFLGSTAGATRIQHREYVETVSAGGSDVFSSFLINPANTTLFPWLAQLSGAWEKFVFHKLVFEYVPTCAVTAEGEFGMFIDYDCKDVVASTYQEFMNSKGATSAAYYTSNALVANVQEFQVNRRAHLTARAQQSTEMLNYYPGRFTTYKSLSAVATKGRLYVDYDVSLLVPQGITNDYAYYLDLNSAVLIANGTNLITRYYAMAGTTNAELGSSWKVVGGYLVCQVPGTFLITVNVISANTNSVTLTPAGTAVSNEYHEVLNGTAVLTVQRVIATYGDTLDWLLDADVTVTAIDVRIGKYVSF